MESAFGDVVVNRKHMRPVLPALAALAWGEPRRRAYWEQELLNALLIIDRGWAHEQGDAGLLGRCHGHTQWMPEVWLNMGVDGNGDGKISPFGSPDDAFAGTAQYLLKRGRYRRNEGWGYEVRLPANASRQARQHRAHGKSSGVGRANGHPFPRPGERRSIWQPVAGGPSFSSPRISAPCDPITRRTATRLATVHLADRIRGEGPFVQQFPGGERIPTLAEAQEMQRLLTAQGLRHRRGRRSHRTRDGARRARIPDQGRHETCRRLCRLESAGATAPGNMSGSIRCPSSMRRSIFGARARRRHRIAPTPYLVEDAIRGMDEAGVDGAILHPPASWDPDSNEQAVEAVLAYPRRFAILGYPPVDRPDSPIADRDLETAPGHAGLAALFQ